MKIQDIVSASLLGLILLSLSCGTPSASVSEDDAPFDVETGYFNLSKEVQTEVLGTQVKSMGEMRKDLLAQADTDADGQLSEAEKAALRTQWKELKEKIKAKLKAEIDADQDGEVSEDEKKDGLNNLGQKIKEAIQTKHEEMRAAQDAAREKIREACAEVRGQGAQLQKPEGAGKSAEITEALDECQAIAAEEREKLQAVLKDALAALKLELDELKGLLATVETQNNSI